MSDIERRTGRILRVWEEAQGTSLTADAAATDTVLEVDDVSPFNDADSAADGTLGWLLVGDETHAYTAVDDEASTITLATALSGAWSDGEDVVVWNELYAEVDTIQRAHVVVDGNDNNVDVIETVVSDALTDLPNGDRGGPREPCVIERDGDEWVLIHAWGRPSLARGLKFEANDSYILTPDDVTAGTATIPLSQTPVDESLKLWWNTVWQEPTEYTVNIAEQTVTFPLDGFESAGQRVAVHYAYRRSLTPESLAFGESWASYVAELGPIQWLRLNEDGVGETGANDSSGFFRGCSLEGMTGAGSTIAGATADGDTALDLNGTNQSISYNDDSSWVPKPNQSWSALALFKTGMSGTGTLVSMCPNGTTAASTTLLFHVGLAGAGVLSTRTWDSSADCAAAGTVNDGSWHKGVVTYNGTTRLLSLYLDGVLADSATQNTTFDTADRTLQWGDRRTGGATFDRYFDGVLDECLLFNFELSAEQVSNLWAAKDIA